MRTIHKSDVNAAGGCRPSQKGEKENISYFSIKHLLSFLFSALDRLSFIEYNHEVKLLIFKHTFLVPIQCWGRKLQGSLFLIAYHWAAKRRGRR